MRCRSHSCTSLLVRSRRVEHDDRRDLGQVEVAELLDLAEDARQLRDERLNSLPFDLQSEQLGTQRRDARGGDLLHAVLSSSRITPCADRSSLALHTARYLTRKSRSLTSLDILRCEAL